MLRRPKPIRYQLKPAKGWAIFMRCFCGVVVLYDTRSKVYTQSPLAPGRHTRPNISGAGFDRCQ